MDNAIVARILFSCCISGTFLLFVDEEPDISECDFKPKPGDRVQVNLDCDIFEAMQQNHGGWHPVLAKVSM